MEFANQAWFDRPEARLLASGADLRADYERKRPTEIVGPGGEVLALITNGGIDRPQRTELLPETRIVRLAGSLRSPDLPGVAASGCWWLEWKQYKRVEALADARGLSMPVALRLLACVPPEWNQMTVLVQARLKLPLLAFAGPSASVVTHNRQFGVNEYLDGIDDGGDRIEQLYIPGLGSPDLRHDALMIEGYGHLPNELSRAGYIIRLQS